MSVLYEPFKDEDAIAAALDRYWEEARRSIVREGLYPIDDDRIAERALEIAKKEARK